MGRRVTRECIRYISVDRWIRLTALTHWWVDDSFQMQSSCVCRQWYFSKTVDAGVDTCGLWLHQCFDNINNAIWCRVIVSCSRITDRTVLARMNRSIDWLLDWSIDRFIDRLICWSCCDVKMMMRLVRMLLWQRTWNSWPPQKSTSTTHNNCKIPHRLHTTTAVIMLVTIIVIVILTSYLLLASMFSSMRLMLAGLKRMMMYCCRLLLFVFSMINASVVYTLFDRFCQQLQSCVRACVCVCVCVYRWTATTYALLIKVSIVSDVVLGLAPWVLVKSLQMLICCFQIHRMVGVVIPLKWLQCYVYLILSIF